MILLIAGVVTILLVAGFARELERLRTMPQLCTTNPPEPPQPLVSVIIPARNEAATIAHCLEGVLAQSYRPYEVIVMNDASTDATGAIVADYATRFGQLRLLTSDGPPPGWTGKANACQQAAGAAQGEWLLFLDSDTVAQPTLLESLVSHTTCQQLDMVSIFPFLELKSFWERLILPPFRAIIYATFPFKRLNAADGRPADVAANGQCLFVRATAYHAIDGHGAVPAAVLEDVRLAQTMRQAGFRVGAADGTTYARTRMYTSGHEVIEGLTKNAAAGYVSGGRRSLGVGIWQFFLALAPCWLTSGGLVLLARQDTPQGWFVFGCGLMTALVALAFWSLLLHRLYRLPAWYAWLWPIGLTCYGIIVLRSMWHVRSGRGVRWKGRKYVGT